MHIERLRVLNYKSFRDSGFIEFRPGFNVIVGQNNAGKTALLEALGLHMGESKPHRRLDVRADQPIDPHCLFEFDLNVTGDEVLEAFVSVQGYATRQALEEQKQSVPLPAEATIDRFSCAMQTNRGGAWHPKPDGVSHPPLYLNPHGKVIGYDEAQKGAPVFHAFSDYSRADLVSTLWNGMSERLYVFKAERMNVSKYHLADDRVLKPNAENLPSVLANLFNNKPGATRRFNKEVSEVLPSIQLVQSPNISGSYHIRIQNRGIDPDRNDLAHGLEDCGAGVGQVLAILYVAMTMPPSVIIIDEPNSFLHPGAAKKLLQILAQYDHQYIISTHSTDIIASVAPSTLHLVKWADGESKVIPINIEDLDDLRLVLSEVGIGLSDMFAADRVVWVEGKTEELCFPLLVKAQRGNMPIGKSFIGLRNTGEFDGKKVPPAEQILELYEKLGNANGVMPNALAFSLDREERTEAKIAGLRHRFKGKLHFLPRRCYENYLLDVDAISGVLSKYAAEGTNTSINAVSAFLANESNKFGTEGFVARIDGAKLLESLFSELSETTVAFDKVRHSVELTKWLLENKPAVLEELTNYVLTLIERNAVAQV